MSANETTEKFKASPKPTSEAPLAATHGSAHLKSLNWQIWEAGLGTFVAIMVAIVSWQFALGMLFMAWVAVLDHRYGKDDAPNVDISGGKK